MNEKFGLSIITRKDERYVSARELHGKLEIKSQFTHWFERMLEYGFVRDIDYKLVSLKKLTNNPRNPETEITDYNITVSMAKEICMLQRNEMGKRFRQYFIEVERLWREQQTEQYKIMRTKSKEIRNNFTDVLKEHGYTQSREYAMTTQNMKKPFGITKRKDEMTTEELKRISLSEDLARLMLRDEEGYGEVNPVCVDASEVIAGALRKRLTA